MEPEPSNVLRTLAVRYERSRAGRTGQSTSDLIVDYEDLLHEANCNRGEARLCAERDLSDANARGLLIVERHRRTGLPLRLRFSSVREFELFQYLGLPPPGSRRHAFAALFLEAAAFSVPSRWEAGLKIFCARMAAAAASGESVAPFSREQSTETQEILSLLPHLLVSSCINKGE